MKLDRGNPNLMKKAMRVNANAPLGAFISAIGDKEQLKYRTGYVPSKRDPDAVLAPSLSIWDRPIYKPDHSGYQRPGADHSRIKSRGF